MKNISITFYSLRLKIIPNFGFQLLLAMDNHQIIEMNAIELAFKWLLAVSIETDEHLRA